MQTIENLVIDRILFELYQGGSINNSKLLEKAFYDLNIPKEEQNKVFDQVLNLLYQKEYISRSGGSCRLIKNGVELFANTPRNEHNNAYSYNQRKAEKLQTRPLQIAAKSLRLSYFVAGCTILIGIISAIIQFCTLKQSNKDLINIIEAIRSTPQTIHITIDTARHLSANTVPSVSNTTTYPDTPSSPR